MKKWKIRLFYRMSNTFGATYKDTIVEGKSQKEAGPQGRQAAPYQYQVVTGHCVKQACAEAMGIDWMIMRELSEAIPPAYTEYIGKYLIKEINVYHNESQDFET